MNEVPDSIGSADSSATGSETDRVEAQLRDLILNMDLAPGDVISRSDVMSRLQCGQTPVRQALERLIQQGLVVSLPRRGYLISPLNIDSLSELLEFVVVVEVMAARLAATRVSACALQRLEGIAADVDALTISDGHRAFVRLDQEFHLTIGEASGNRYVSETLSRLLNLLQRYVAVGVRGSWQSTVPERAAVWLRELRPLIEALGRHDPDAAERCIARHLAGGKERIRSHL